MYTGTGLNKMHDNQADKKSKSGNYFKIQQRFTAHTAYSFQAVHARNTHNDSAENHWRNDHFDKIDERIAKGLEFNSNIRGDKAKRNTQGNAYKNFEI